MRNNFSKGPVDAPLHNYAICHDFPFAFVIFRACVLLHLQLPKEGCYPTTFDSSFAYSRTHLHCYRYEGMYQRFDLDVVYNRRYYIVLTLINLIFYYDF